MTTEINAEENIFTKYRRNLELMNAEIVEIAECPFEYIANLGDISKNYLFFLSNNTLSYVRKICDSFVIEDGILIVIFDETREFPKTEVIINLKDGLIENIEASDIAFKKLPENPSGILKINYVGNISN